MLPPNIHLSIIQPYFLQIRLIQRCLTYKSQPVPYLCPMPLAAHPPIASMMSAGHSMAGSLALRLCRNEWITHPVGARGSDHLFNAELAEIELHFLSLQYLEKANPEWDDAIFWQPKAKNLPTEFTAGWMLLLVCATGAQLGRQRRSSIKMNVRS